MEEIKLILNGRDNSINIKGGSDFNSPYPEILPTILHKLKNKLTPILGYSQILQMKNPEDSIRQKIDSIERNASELTKLFESLRDSLIIPKSVTEMYSLNSLILNEKEFFDNIVDSGIKIFLDLNNTIPQSFFNSRMISLLIQNVVRNSVFAIINKNIPDGIINIKTDLQKDMIILKIRDNGIGIEESKIMNIWTPFYSEFSDQSGIGLLVVEKAVTNHKGTCTVESEIGEFTEFTFAFPVLREDQVNSKKSGSVEIKKILFIGFGTTEITLTDEILKEKSDIKIYETDMENIRDIKIPESGFKIVFVNVEEKNVELPDKLVENFPGSKIFFLYKNDITDNLKLYINKKDTRFCSTKNKILTIISIIATVINKEES